MEVSNARKGAFQSSNMLGFIPVVVARPYRGRCLNPPNPLRCAPGDEYGLRPKVTGFAGSNALRAP